MALYRIDFFAPHDLNGSPIGTIDSDEDDLITDLILRPRIRSVGGMELAIRRDLGDLIDSGIMAAEAFMRVVIPSVHATKYLWGAFINFRDQTLVSTRERAGEGFVIQGYGPKFYLDRAILWDEKFGPSGTGFHIDLDNGVFYVNANMNVGEALVAMFAEDENAALFVPQMLPDLTINFDETNDSNGSPWTSNYNLGDGFELPIGQSYLTNLFSIQDAQDGDNPVEFFFDLGEVGSPLMELNARKNYGRDLTGTTFEAGTVLLREGVNLVGEFQRGSSAARAPRKQASGTATRKATHALVRGKPPFYGRAALSSYAPGEYAKGVMIDAGHYGNDVVLDRIGLRWLRHQQNADKEFSLQIVPGFDEDAGHYMAGPNGTNGHIWPGDTVTLKTGQTVSSALEYEFEPQWVTGLDLTLRDAAIADTDDHAAKSFDLTVHLNVERDSDNVRGQGGGGGKDCCNRPTPHLCRPSQPGEILVGQLYYTGGNDVTSGVTDADYAATWDFADTVIGPQRLRTTPQDTLGNVGAGSGFDGIGIPAETIATHIFTFPLSDSADVLAGVQNGGTWQTVIRSKNRFGVGVNDAVQQNFPTGAIRVFRPGTGFIGTILDVGDWQAAYRFDPGPAYPSIPMEAAGAAVPSAVGTDYLVVDLGADHQNPTSGATGWDYRFSDQSGVDDLPFVVDSVADQNSWLSVTSIGDPAGPGAGHVNLVGTSTDFKRCDDTEHWHDSRPPTALDDEDQGMRVGTLWLDETTGRVWWLTDNTAGAAVWILITDPTATSGGGGGASLTIEEEDGAPTGIFDTLKVPNGRLTDNGDGSASLDFAASVHAHGTPTAGFRGVLVRRTTDFTSTNSNDSVPDFDDALYDTDSFWDAGDPDRLTIPADLDGLMMQFYASGLWGTSTDDYVELKLYRNVTRPIDASADEPNLIAVTQIPPSSAFNTEPILISPPVQVATGDEFYVAFRTPASETVVDYHNVSLLFGGWLVGGGGGSSLIVREVGGSDIDPTSELEFDADDFVVTDEGGGVARVALAAPASSGGVGRILIADEHSTPLTFDDLLQNDDGDNFLYEDV